jgi:hypothetical protein
MKRQAVDPTAGQTSVAAAAEQAMAAAPAVARRKQRPVAEQAVAVALVVARSAQQLAWEAEWAQAAAVVMAPVSRLPRRVPPSAAARRIPATRCAPGRQHSPQ